MARCAAGVSAIFAALLLPACGDGDSDSGSSAGPVPDFLLLDENPASASFQASVSPRDYMGKTPGVYFTHAS